MPELPEVITIKKDLEKEVIGKKISKLINKNWNFKTDFNYFVSQLEGSTIQKVDNVAKLLLLNLENKSHIAIHLNMSGRLLYNTTDDFEKVRILFSDNSFLSFSSVRRFEYFELWNDKDLEIYKKKYGKTIIDSTLSFEEFLETQKKQNKPIKTNLLNQKLISGIGNIYAIDALYESGINPYRKSQEVTSLEYKKLFENLQKLINEGILHRGSTIDRYVDLYGKAGTHQNHFRVYGKKNNKCKDCNTQIIFEKFQGRGTYYCPTCQKKDIGIKLF
ncbi:bifunctional DNA-formamidopyrimidine glycosylase/DNA-(apurinic or apyrimidinic site) lyase [Patescibacteria group bacterium]|nr:bifunctional DNA-formamidopyrimidine glycosylase/DNA-(apurinic or apyrimidinic site) lyase [Patescibacteria group bacterium]